MTNRKMVRWKCCARCGLLLLLASVGCQPEATSPEMSGMDSEAAVRAHQEELLDLAVDNLDRLEEFGSTDAIRQIFEGLDPQNQPKPGERFDPLLAAWPESEMLSQIVDRLNQWVRAQQSLGDWKADPMISGLPKRLASMPQLATLERLDFTPFDGYFLQESVWLRDIGVWARGDVLDELDRAKNVFDWTVRNIQIEPDRPDRTPQFPWETLFFGRGTAAERAWVSILLLRQLDIDAAMLAVDSRKEEPRKLAAEASAKDSRKEQGKAEKVAEKKALPALDPAPPTAPGLRPWCVGVLIDGEVYLFDPLLGLPIPAKKGITRAENGQLDITPATLNQVVAEPKLLRRMDAPSHRYGIAAEDLKHVVALLEASPDYLSQRMRLLESRLKAGQRIVLTTSPTEHAQRWKAAKHIADARLWLTPFETLDCRSHLERAKVQRQLASLLPFFWLHEERITVRNRDEEAPSEQQRVVLAAALGQARTLHLKGKLTGDDGAIQYYQMARPSDERLLASSVPTGEKAICFRGKQDATYWLGLIAYERGKYETAIDSLTNRTHPPLVAAEGPWTVGARYNLARMLEASGEIGRAVQVYRNNESSPGFQGDLLRAQWLVEAWSGKPEPRR
ncbi:MAG: hypothetical protein ABFC63_07790 [Thermoguttaceae bacterium]